MRSVVWTNVTVEETWGLTPVLRECKKSCAEGALDQRETKGVITGTCARSAAYPRNPRSQFASIVASTE